MSRATNPSTKLVKGASCDRKVSNILSYRNFWALTLPAGLYRPLSSLRRTLSEKKSGFSPLSERPERRAPSSSQKDFNVERNSETDPFTVICSFPIAQCPLILSSDQPGSRTVSLYRLLKRMSTSNNGLKPNEKLLSDKSTYGIMDFEVKTYFEFSWRRREEVILALTIIWAPSISTVPSFKAFVGGPRPTATRWLQRSNATG